MHNTLLIIQKYPKTLKQNITIIYFTHKINNKYKTQIKNITTYKLICHISVAYLLIGLKRYFFLKTP